MNKTKQSKTIPSFILCMALIVAAALFTAGCNLSITKNESNTKVKSQAKSNVPTENNTPAESNVLGEGSTKFTFTVVDQKKQETQFEIHTDRETVGEALLELGLITGEDSKYGLFVKTVNGITADYDKDGAYWAFYINGEYAQTGVESTAVTEGECYSFQME